MPTRNGDAWQIDNLNHERLSLLDFLSSTKRDAITGFGTAAIDQAGSEARQLGLVLRYHWHATANWIMTLRHPKGALGRSAASALLVFVERLFAIAVFVAWRRRATDTLQKWRETVKERDRQSRLSEHSFLDKTLGLLQAVRRPLEWLPLLLVFRWLLPSTASGLLEIQLISIVLLWALTGTLVVVALNALATLGGSGAKAVSTVDASSLRLRSLRLVGRVIVVLGLILVITSRLVG